MRINLTSKPKNPTIIIGAPGIGLIGPIVTEFLIEHMSTAQIGAFEYNELAPIAAIHKGKLVNPMSIHYSAEKNTIIVYTILNIKEQEWEVSKAISEMAKELDAKEIICIDGTTAPEDTVAQVYCFGNDIFAKNGAKQLEESVINGICGAMLLDKHVGSKTSCLFATTHSEMPDSKAAAEIVKIIGAYLTLNIDCQPLLAQAQQFEDKLKSMIVKNKKMTSEQERKTLDYLG